MSRLLFDYGCTSCGHEFEELVTLDERVIACPECHELTAARRLAAPRIDPKLGVSNDFPSMAKKWAKTQRQRQSQVARLRRDHGDTR